MLTVLNALLRFIFDSNKLNYRAILSNKTESKLTPVWLAVTIFENSVAYNRFCVSWNWSSVLQKRHCGKVYIMRSMSSKGKRIFHCKTFTLTAFFSKTEQIWRRSLQLSNFNDCCYGLGYVILFDLVRSTEGGHRPKYFNKEWTFYIVLYLLLLSYKCLGPIYSSWCISGTLVVHCGFHGHVSFNFCQECPYNPF